MGQSNIPAGATIGSNHNSRGADGEIIAARGFWPGLCVSLKHNSKFASFTILAKGDYSYELNIPVPFSLVSIDHAHDKLVVMPAYWFMYNMYALARNSWKYADRDKRKQKIQHLETDYSAPDTVNEMFTSLRLIALFTGKAYFKKNNNENEMLKDDVCIEKGHELLKENNSAVDELEIIADGFENTKRKTVIVKARKAYRWFTDMIRYYGITQLLRFIQNNEIESADALQEKMPMEFHREEWMNVGEQLFPVEVIERLKNKIKSAEINSWDELHDFYKAQGNDYPQQKMLHGLAGLAEIENVSLREVDEKKLNEWFAFALEMKALIVKEIYRSREKDYINPYRKMVYDSQEEMNKVLGELENNSFIKQQQDELQQFKADIAQLQQRFQIKAMV